MRRIAILLLVAAAGLPRAAGADPAPVLLDDEKALFAWWDGLGYPDVTKLPLVRATTGLWWGSGSGGLPHAIPDHVFLVADDGERFTTFSTELRIDRHERSPAATPAHERVGIERLDVLSWAEAGVRTLKLLNGPVPWFQAIEDPSLDPFQLHRYLVPNQAFRLVVVARTCAGRNRPDLAHALLEAALRDWAPGWEDKRPPMDAGRFAALKRDLADEAFLAAEARVGDALSSLVEVRDGLRRFAASLPDHAHAAEARADVEVLTRMIADEAARPPAQPGGARSVEDLVFSLRSITGHWYLGGEIQQFAKKANEEPLRALQRIGMPAVPTLVAAIDDRSFTRSTLEFAGGHAQFRWSWTPYRVEDAAIDALDAISGRAFRADGASPWSLHPWDEKERLALRERIREWSRAAAEGEAALLAFTVTGGTERAVAAAERLVTLAPDRAVPALVRGTFEAADPARAGSLTELLGEVPGEAASAALLDLLARGVRLRVRLSAAKVLLDRGRIDGVARMIEEWLHPAPIPPAPGATIWPEWPSRGPILAFLVTSGEPAAYRALATGLTTSPAALRGRIVATFLLETAKRPLSKEARDAVEALLGGRLSDSDVAVRPWTGPGDDPAPLIGLLAAQALAAWLPDVYRFDPKAPAAEREAQRAAAEALFRSRRPAPR